MDKLDINMTLMNRLIDVVNRILQIYQNIKDALLMNQQKIIQAFRYNIDNLFEINNLVLMYDKFKKTSHSNKLIDK